VKSWCRVLNCLSEFPQEEAGLSKSFVPVFVLGTETEWGTGGSLEKICSVGRDVVL